MKSGSLVVYFLVTVTVVLSTMPLSVHAGTGDEAYFMGSWILDNPPDTVNKSEMEFSYNPEGSQSTVDITNTYFVNGVESTETMLAFWELSGDKILFKIIRINGAEVLLIGEWESYKFDDFHRKLTIDDAVWIQQHQSLFSICRTYCCAICCNICSMFVILIILPPGVAILNKLRYRRRQ